MYGHPYLLVTELLSMDERSTERLRVESWKPLCTATGVAGLKSDTEQQ